MSRTAYPSGPFGTKTVQRAPVLEAHFICAFELRPFTSTRAVSGPRRARARACASIAASGSSETTHTSGFGARGEDSSPVASRSRSIPIENPMAGVSGPPKSFTS